MEQKTPLATRLSPDRVSQAARRLAFASALMEQRYFRQCVACEAVLGCSGETSVDISTGTRAPLAARLQT
eukprot:4794055-Amphidinium_carterae.1